MNAHSEWIKWQKQYRLPDGEYNDHSSTFPWVVRYDWKGVGMEGAFKAGYNASFKELAPRKKLAGYAAELESDLEAIRDIVERR